MWAYPPVWISNEFIKGEYDSESFVLIDSSSDSESVSCQPIAENETMRDSGSDRYENNAESSEHETSSEGDSDCNFNTSRSTTASSDASHSSTPERIHRKTKAY